MDAVKFSLGQVVCTPGALEEIPLEEIFLALKKHKTGNWGFISSEDAEENEIALKEGFRLLSVYRTTKNIKFWVITEADRSVTTVLLPEEY